MISKKSNGVSKSFIAMRWIYGVVLAATEDDLEELIGAVAAEANHEPNRRRQRRLDAAFDVLNHAAASLR